MDEAEDKPGGDNTDKTDKSKGEGGRGGGDFFGIAGGKKVFKSAGEKHKKKNQASNGGDDLEDVKEKAFEALNGGNIAMRDTAARPGALRHYWRRKQQITNNK